MAQALQARRDRLRRQPRRQRLQQPARTPRASRPSPATYSGFDEIAFNTGAALDDGTPIGDGHPALKDKRVRAGHRLRDRQARRWSTRCSAATATPGTSDHPADLREPALRPGRDRRTRSTSAKANQLLDEAGYTKGAGRHPHDARRRQAAELPAVRPRRSSQTSKQTVQFVAGLAQGHRHRRRRSRSCPRTRSPRSSARASTTCSSGAGSSSPTRTTSCRRSPAPTGRTRTAAAIYADLSDSLLLQQGVRRAVRAAGGADRRRRSAPTIVKQMQKMLYDDAPYVVTDYYDNLEAYRSDRFTNFQPQPDPKRRRCSSSTAPTPTSRIEPVSAATKKSGGGSKDAASSTLGGWSSASVVGGAVADRRERCSSADAGAGRPDAEVE